jgi:hypothetical protein
MRLRIDTSNVRFRVAGLAQPRNESRENKRQKTTPDGRPIWTVRLIAIDSAAASTETIWVEVAGDQPQLVLDEIAAVQGLTFSPWVNRKHELVRAFRAEAITIDGTARRAAA